MKVDRKDFLGILRLLGLSLASPGKPVECEDVDSIEFNDEGTEMGVELTNGASHKYNLSTPWDLTTITYKGKHT